MEKIKLIAETAWHHDGDFAFMQKLVNEILKKSKLDILKMHLTLDLIGRKEYLFQSDLDRHNAQLKKIANHFLLIRKKHN